MGDTEELDSEGQWERTGRPPAHSIQLWSKARSLLVSTSTGGWAGAGVEWAAFPGLAVGS